MHDPQAFAIKKGYVVKIYHSQYINEKKKKQGYVELKVLKHHFLSLNI